MKALIWPRGESSVTYLADWRAGVRPQRSPRRHCECGCSGLYYQGVPIQWEFVI